MTINLTEVKAIMNCLIFIISIYSSKNNQAIDGKHFVITDKPPLSYELSMSAPDYVVESGRGWH